MRRLLRPFRDRQTYLSVVFYVAQLVLGVVGFALLLAGWPITLLFCITPLVVPLLIGLRLGVGLLARAQAGLAGGLLRLPVRTPVSTEAPGFWSRGFSVLRDPMFWKQQAYLLLAAPTAFIPLALLYNSLELISLPFWAPRVESYEVFGVFEIDSVGEALLFAVVGLVALTGIVHLLGPYARLSRWLASRLLSGDPGPVRSPAEIRARRFRALTVDAIVSTSLAVVLVVIWGLTTPDGYFWPIWPMLALALVVAVPAWIVAVLENDDIRRLALGSTALAIQIGASAVLLGFLVAVWAITTAGPSPDYFWPIWVALGLALLAAVHAAVVYGRRVHRVEQLEESRAAAVDVQETELRRIERDLHDGAQARLVALGMSLGMAEDKLRTDPEGAQELLAEARSGAREALEELRVLARGIHPPILTDRGLEAAIAALVTRSPIHVTLSVNVPERPPAAVETAAYFVVSEALANAIKYSHASRIEIRIWSSMGRLLAEIVDDGRGGADVSGNGLTGLQQRLRALDGVLRVESPDGGPTTLRAELPCG
jgi:signal transduction histidine kinase